MKIIPLIDYSVSDSNLLSEHGLSLYIETEKNKVLFDTGQTDLFIRNAEKIGINLKEVDIVVISHGHYNNIEGLIHFLKINKTAKVFSKREALNGEYSPTANRQTKGINYSPELEPFIDRFVFLNVGLYMVDNLTFISSIDSIYPTPKNNDLPYENKTGKVIHDSLKHELVFTITTGNKAHIFSSGVSSGILNTVATAQRFLMNKKVGSVIGGFQVTNESMINYKESKFVGEELKRLTDTATFYTGHSTQAQEGGILSQTLGSQLQQLVVGREVSII